MKHAPWAAIVLAVLSNTTAHATSYHFDDTWGVACLDLTTGRQIFDVLPGPLRSPRIEAGRSTVLVTDASGHQYALDAKTGATLATVFPAEELAPPLEPLPRNLTSDDGITLAFREGYTKNLEFARPDGGMQVIRELNYFHGLRVVGHLAILTHAGGISAQDVGGGEVHAFDIATGDEVWTYRAAERDPGVQSADWTGIEVDGDRLLVTVNQMIHVIDARSGAWIATWRLPRQVIHDYDSAWTSIARHGDRYFVTCYHFLFVLDLDGRLIWSYDPVWPAVAWPTVVGSRVYVETYRHVPREPSLEGRRDWPRDEVASDSFPFPRATRMDDWEPLRLLAGELSMWLPPGGSVDSSSTGHQATWKRGAFEIGVEVNQDDGSLREPALPTFRCSFMESHVARTYSKDAMGAWRAEVHVRLGPGFAELPLFPHVIVSGSGSSGLDFAEFATVLRSLHGLRPLALARASRQAPPAGWWPPLRLRVTKAEKPVRRPDMSWFPAGTLVATLENHGSDAIIVSPLGEDAPGTAGATAWQLEGADADGVIPAPNLIAPDRMAQPSCGEIIIPPRCSQVVWIGTARDADQARARRQKARLSLASLITRPGRETPTRLVSNRVRVIPR